MNRIKKIIHANQVYALGYTGKDITIAMVDTGVRLHPDLKKSVRVFKDFVNYKREIYDDNGHGTHVAGILSGDGTMSNGRISGMAKDARLVVLKVLDEKGNGDTADVMEAFYWIKENYKNEGIRLLNFSLGFLPNSNVKEQKELMEMIDHLWELGIMVVTAAGNNGPSENSITVPGISRNVLTVGASDDQNPSGRMKSGYSGRGPTSCCIVKPEILAPGTNVLSCDSRANGYVYKSGTSMSVPVVCGALALAFEKNPGCSPEEMKIRLYDTVEPRGSELRKNAWGILNVDNLIQMN